MVRSRMKPRKLNPCIVWVQAYNFISWTGSTSNLVVVLSKRREAMNNSLVRMMRSRMKCPIPFLLVRYVLKLMRINPLGVLEPGDREEETHECV